MTTLPANIARYVQPWNRALWYWEVAELRQFVAAQSVQTDNLHCEGLKEAARLVRKNFGHEECNYHAVNKQQERAAKYAHMDCANRPQCECNKHA